MSDQNVRNAGFTPSGITKGSLGSSLMSQEARASGGGVPSGGATSTLQEMGMSSSVCDCVCGFVVQRIGSDSCFSLKISSTNNLFSPTPLYGTEGRRFLCLTVCYEWDIIEGAFCVYACYA